MEEDSTSQDWPFCSSAEGEGASCGGLVAEKQDGVSYITAETNHGGASSKGPSTKLTLDNGVCETILPEAMIDAMICVG